MDIFLRGVLCIGRRLLPSTGQRALRQCDAWQKYEDENSEEEGYGGFQYVEPRHQVFESRTLTVLIVVSLNRVSTQHEKVA